MILFTALTLFAVAIAGFCALLIFWPLTLIHLRDRHPRIHDDLGVGAFFKPSALWWLLGGRYRAAADRNLDGLATPARVSLAVTLIGLIAAGVLWLWSVAYP
jgi:hypothetical protein